jgi:hypothetical protein
MDSYAFLFHAFNGLPQHDILARQPLYFLYQL